mmetsp:Transcript_16576/g.34124  ORF Transcript_16576/g.34124 Transcript_16576/m.34124 type:complete len:119 (+) Transcript_16576:2124-2480(+)
MSPPSIDSSRPPRKTRRIANPMISVKISMTLSLASASIHKSTVLLRFTLRYFGGVIQITRDSINFMYGQIPVQIQSKITISAPPLSYEFFVDSKKAEFKKILHRERLPSKSDIQIHDG